MKKSAVIVLLCISLMFAAFVGGFYIGRNYCHDNLYIQGAVPSANTTQPSSQSTMPDVTTAPGITATVPSSGTSPSVPDRININTAGLELLDTLPGIGPAIAQAIIDYRTEYGPFEKPEDLLNVSGIGEKKLQNIIDRITTGG